MDYETFVTEVVRDLPKPPQYFFYNAGLNKNTITSDLNEILKKSNKKLSPQDAKLTKTAQIIDSRNSIAEGFIPGSINVPLQIPFAHWVGTLLPHNKEVIIVCEKGTEEQTIMRLSRIGYDNILGYMYFEEWQQAGEFITKPTELEKQALMNISKQGSEQIIDVRSFEEWRKGKLDNAKLFPLNELLSNMERLNRNQQINIYCGTGQRAKIACTLLIANGFKNVQYCKVGYDEIIKP
ncbi:unnamed protein product [Paramecium octaurelia]|nr:unnamed protein product [Paramecium octaurelia]